MFRITKNKKAQVTVIMGIMLTILIIALFGYIGMKLFTWTDDRRVTETFGEFISTIEKVNNAGDDASDSVLVYLKDQYGIVGFSGLENFEAYQTDQDDGAVVFHERQKPIGTDFIVIPRSSECRGTNTCICLYDFRGIEDLGVFKEGKVYEMNLPPAVTGDSHMILHQCHTLDIPLTKLQNYAQFGDMHYFWKNGFFFLQGRYQSGATSLKTRITEVIIQKKDGILQICSNKDCTPTKRETEVFVNV